MMKIEKMVKELEKGKELMSGLIKGFDDWELTMCSVMMGGDVKGIDGVLRWIGKDELVRMIGKVEKVGMYLVIKNLEVRG